MTAQVTTVTPFNDISEEKTGRGVSCCNSVECTMMGKCLPGIPAIWGLTVQMPPYGQYA